MFGAALVLVTWHDSNFSIDNEEPPEDYLIESVGWIINQGPRFLTIASEQLPDGDGYRGISHILLSTIEHVENLTVG